ncbi:uncharacterized protein HMPREF1541_04578 [Cyphellophora europaea CBS 101466]|uniref:Uncharacterized protein n=1 Tax=Cyphellophora europaea (strain CBS 101466) TaxID=1220924 RepID=W2RV32_CYPE1|nr:uncharacterized protein HMPREF1541_04578 [Cyphellophora europaea CBS 101466]ETN40302.1 hypothetical protein HMPREF1541_04578 [Cyphellophora europaea CBS 101466]
MAQAFPNAFAVDQPEGSARTNPYAADAFIEPWLLKHSEFYRKHLTRDGRRSSKSTRRASRITLESRKNSLEPVVSPGAVAAAERADSVGATSIEEDRLKERMAQGRQDKEKSSWRRHLHL